MTDLVVSSKLRIAVNRPAFFAGCAAFGVGFPLVLAAEDKTLARIFPTLAEAVQPGAAYLLASGTVLLAVGLLPEARRTTSVRLGIIGLVAMGLGALGEQVLPDTALELTRGAMWVRMGGHGRHSPGVVDAHPNDHIRHRVMGRCHAPVRRHGAYAPARPACGVGRAPCAASSRWPHAPLTALLLLLACTAAPTTDASDTAGDTGTPPLDLDICDGSTTTRLAFSWWTEATTVLEDRFLRRDGLQAFTVDGTCAFTVFDGDHPPHFAWNPVQTGTLTPDDLDAFLDVLAPGAWPAFTDDDLGEPAAPFHPAWTVFRAGDDRWSCSGGCSGDAAFARDRGIAATRWLRERATNALDGDMEAIVITAPGDTYAFHEAWGAQTALYDVLVDLQTVAAQSGPVHSEVPLPPADVTWLRNILERFQSRSLQGVAPQTGIGIDDGEGTTRWELYVRHAGDVFEVP